MAQQAEQLKTKRNSTPNALVTFFRDERGSILSVPVEELVKTIETAAVALIAIPVVGGAVALFVKALFDSANASSTVITNAQNRWKRDEAMRQDVEIREARQAKKTKKTTRNNW